MLVFHVEGGAFFGSGERVDALWLFAACQSENQIAAMAKSQASNFHLPSYWWPRSRTRSQVSWKKSSARSRLAVRCSR